ncbi:thioredoxin-related transmembrane protein 1-like [Anneissia japonica]|uniref:thioredoxin-related transmembrane protein 1-like n=1 Tax=Anneissia japonica TaxID=1529436 RepID=UPI0014259125|nr:thioredoxin-related transmembrane protein 1-like [Anneissia japonica]
MIIKSASLLLLLIIASIVTTQEALGSVEISDETWRDMEKGEWLVKFYAPWCPACRSLEPIWNKIARKGKDLDISVGEVDVTAYPGLSGRFVITALPTIYHVINGEYRKYQGGRTEDDIIQFIQERKYIDLEPVPGWYAPGSFIMSILSWLFKISMTVRVIHTVLTEDYGIPPWSSYTLFALLTIAIGLFLGLILVLISDCICPSKAPKEPAQTTPPAQDTEQDKEKKTGKDKKGKRQNKNGEKKEEKSKEGTEGTELRQRTTEES